jgi:hypothetical protein
MSVTFTIFCSSLIYENPYSCSVVPGHDHATLDALARPVAVMGWPNSGEGGSGGGVGGTTLAGR